MITAGGMPGWQITLIALAAALTAATAAVILDRADQPPDRLHHRMKPSPGSCRTRPGLDHHHGPGPAGTTRQATPTGGRSGARTPTSAPHKTQPKG